MLTTHDVLGVSLFLIFWMMTTVLVGPLDAATYYVDMNNSQADDGNAGTMILPWKTIQHAADVMQPGDTSYIRNGIYSEQVFSIRSGNELMGSIVFAAFPGEHPILDGTGVASGNTGMFINHSRIKVIGLEIRNWSDTGIWMSGAGYVDLTDLLVHHVTYGIGAADGMHDFTLTRVELHSFQLYGFDASPSGGADCYNGTFIDCTSHSGSDAGQNVDGFALGHGSQHGFTFERCEVWDVFDGFDISSEDTVLDRCSAHHCWNGGYKIWQDNISLVNCLGYASAISNLELDWDGTPGTTTLQNCTFWDAGTFSIWVENAGDSLHMFNCIIAGGDNIGLAFEMSGISTYDGDYNVFHNDNADRAIAVAYTDEFSLSQIAAGDWTSYTSGQDSHSLVVTDAATLFVNPGFNDLHLLRTSSAVDLGTANSAPTVDFDGVHRPQGNGFDIGAYEFSAIIVPTLKALPAILCLILLGNALIPRGKQ